MKLSWWHFSVLRSTLALSLGGSSGAFISSWHVASVISRVNDWESSNICLGSRFKTSSGSASVIWDSTSSHWCEATIWYWSLIATSSSWWAESEIVSLVYHMAALYSLGSSWLGGSAFSSFSIGFTKVSNVNAGRMEVDFGPPEIRLKNYTSRLTVLRIRLFLLKGISIRKTHWAILNWGVSGL